MALTIEDVGTPSTPSDVEEAGEQPTGGLSSIPYPILAVLFLLLGYVAIRKVWVT